MVQVPKRERHQQDCSTVKFLGLSITASMRKALTMWLHLIYKPAPMHIWCSKSQQLNGSSSSSASLWWTPKNSVQQVLKRI